MEKDDGMSPLDRRVFLAAGASTLLGASTGALAQQPPAPKAGEGEGAKPTQLVAEFIAGFELKNAPALAVERARSAFIDTVGVMLAGSRSRAGRDRLRDGAGRGG